jgi:hypothetical protein
MLSLVDLASLDVIQLLYVVELDKALAMRLFFKKFLNSFHRGTVSVLRVAHEFDEFVGLEFGVPGLELFKFGCYGVFGIAYWNIVLKE